jgi:hypothetical protein
VIDYNSIPFKNSAIDKIAGTLGKKRDVGLGDTPQGGYSKIVTVKGPHTSIRRETRLEPSGDVSFSLSKELKHKNRVKTKDVQISDGKGTITTVRKTGKGVVTRERNIRPGRAKRLQRRYTRRVNRMHTDGGPGATQAPTQGGGMIYKYEP